MFDVRGLFDAKDVLACHRAERSARLACQVLTKVDRTLGENSAIMVHAALGNGRSSYPAWSFEGQIWINFIHELFTTLHGDRAFVHLLGMNYHEMAHVLYTPPWDLVPKIQACVNSSPLRADAYNMLEDGRIERLLGTEYPSIRPMLLSTFMNVVSLSDKPHAMWFITAPRKAILPRKLYRTIRKSVLDEGVLSAWDVKQTEKIVSQYINIVPVNDPQKTVELVNAYALRVQRVVERSMKVDKCHDGVVQGGIGNAKIQRSASDQEKLTKKAEAEGDYDDDSASDDSEPDEAPSENDEPTSGGSGSKDDKEPEPDADDADGSGSSDGDDTDGDGTGDAKGDTKEDADDEGGNGAGSSGVGSADAPDLSDIENELNKAQSEIMSSDAVVNELTNHSRAMRSGSSFTSSALTHKVPQFLAPSGDMTRAAKRIGAEFVKLQSQLDPGWERMTQAGKLNVKRYLEGADMDVVFDTWHEDRSEAADVEAFLAMDMSSSMRTGGRGRPPYVEAAKSFWVLRKALSSIGARVTGYGFDTVSYSLFAREDRLPTRYPVWSPGGGTDPTATIDDATILLSRSKARSKVFVVLTDGDWQGDYTAMGLLLDDMRAMGVASCQYRIGSSLPNVPMVELSKHFGVVARIADPMAMVAPVKETIKQLIKRRAS